MKVAGGAKKKKLAEVYNTEIIFSRVMYLLSAGQIDVKDLFNYELAPVPTALFKDTGEGRYPTSKSVLKNSLKAEVSLRNVSPDAVLIDGCAMLHGALHWPKGGKVQDLLTAVRKYILKMLEQLDTYLIFDRYKDFSIKSDTRQGRLEQFRCSHSLQKSSPLPAKEVALRVIKTKQQLIEMVKADLMDSIPHKPKKLVITSQEDTPEQLHLGVQIKREDMKTTQEEADVIIPHQVAAAVEDGKTSIKVICDNTDVFALLCHSYHLKNWQVKLYMADFSEKNRIISINESVENNKLLIPSLLSLHALTGCDTVAMLYGIGKKKAINIAKKYPLSYLGQECASPDQYLSESKKFIAACYGAKFESSSKNR